MAIAIVVSTFALHIASRQAWARPRSWARVSRWESASARCTTLAWRQSKITPAIRYDPFWVAVSFAIRGSRVVRGALDRVLFVEAIRLASLSSRIRAVGMGLAIAGMHYAAMIAAEFPAQAASPASIVDKGWLVAR